MNEQCFETSRDAERAFYAAFERASLSEMMRVWADDDDIMCIHPMGPRLEGRAAVARGWEQIFAGGVSMRFELSEVSCTHSGDLAVHCVYENIGHGPGFGQRSLVLATNVYKSTANGWRMLLHHGSPGGAARAGTETPLSTLH